MSKCYECRGPKGADEFLCGACAKARESSRTFQGAVDKIRGRDGQRGLGAGRVVLTEKERRSLQMQLGVPVSDAQDARRKMKAMGVRLVERGEYADQVDRAAIEWADSGGEARGERPPEILRKFQGWGQRREFKFDHAEEFKRSVAEYKERGGVLTED